MKVEPDDTTQHLDRRDEDRRVETVENIGERVVLQRGDEDSTDASTGLHQATHDVRRLGDEEVRVDLDPATELGIRQPNEVREARIVGVVDWNRNPHRSKFARPGAFRASTPPAAAPIDNEMPAVDLDVALEWARAGEARGFEALFRTLGGAVAGYLRARSVSDPEDLANEVFLRAFKTLHTFRGDAERFRSWLFTIAHHAAIDDRRRASRRPRTVAIEDTDGQSADDVERAILDTAERERIEQLLSTLSPEQREVILLRILGDLSIEQTGAVVGRGYEAVKALQRRGLASLRRRLEAEQGVPR
jgi:RNA polymerase sigma-70 factor (ECF subfamily)